MLDWRILILFYIFIVGIFNLFLKKFASDRSPLIVALVINLVPVPFIFLLNRGYPPLSSVWVYPVISGLFYAIANFVSMKAYSEGDISLIAPLNTMISVFTLILAVIILQESVTLQKLSGIALIFFGMGFLNKSGNIISSLKALSRNRVARFVVMATFFLSVANVVDKFSLRYFDYLSYPTLVFGMTALFLSIYLFFFKTEKVKEIRPLLRERWKYALGSCIFISANYLFFLSIISLVDVSIVNPLVNMSIFVTIILGRVFLNEKVQGRFMAAALMVIGASLLVMPQFF